VIEQSEELQEFSEESIIAQLEEQFDVDREYVLDIPNESEFNISDNNDVAALEQYYNDTLGILPSGENQVVDISDRLFNGMSDDEIDVIVRTLQAVESVLFQTLVPSELIDVHKYKIGSVRAGTRLFEIVRDSDRSNGLSEELWSDMVYYIALSEQGRFQELGAWQIVAERLQDTGGLAELGVE